MSVPVFRGRFGRSHAERLLWRAGFGPRPGDADRLARVGLERAVLSLTRPKRVRLIGPEPRNDKGLPLAPADAYGDDQLWWLDRMVRTNAPLVERMTLIWHDWFATSNAGVGSQRLMLLQNATLRRHALGSFRELLLDVTKDPAMLMWLSGVWNRKGDPNENYARELMELFTLGADRGAYTEKDVREQARALTGWTGQKDSGPQTFFLRAEWHDNGRKTIFGKSGNFDWRDSCELCLKNPKHAAFFVRKLWSYFIPEGPSRATERALERIYLRDYQVRPVVEAILMHPRFYAGPRLVKPPIVYTAGLLRARRKGVAGVPWAWYTGLAGQRLFSPPNVAGWDDDAWLNTNTLYERFQIVGRVIGGDLRDGAREKVPADAETLLRRARAFWGNPSLTPVTEKVLRSAARRALAAGASAHERSDRMLAPASVENVLRHLVAMSPEMQAA